MIIIKSSLFSRFPEIKFGFSTKTGLDRGEPYYFNMSLSVGDNPDIVKENRAEFITKLGLEEENVVFQKQVHGDNISIVEDNNIYPVSDALITKKKGIGLAVSSADCVPIFLYDKKNAVIAAIHSGWRSTELKILEKTLKKLKEEFNSFEENIFAYIAPCIDVKNYEVGEEVAKKFSPESVEIQNKRYFLNLKKENKNMLIASGIPEKHIEISPLCSYEKTDLLHSYRREGIKSGRAIGIIAMSEE